MAGPTRGLQDIDEPDPKEEPMLRRFIAGATGLLILTACAEQPGAAVAAEAPVPLYTDLGTHHYAIATSEPRAQQYFDQGLRLAYAFNHAEAIRAFDEAARLDPTCAMCAWGTAYAYGPNINAPMDSASGALAYAAVRRAQELPGQDERERALIDALAARYADPPPAARGALDSAYARAMGDVHRRWPDDPEIASLYAESVMDLSPWNYWNADGSPRPQTAEIVSALEGVIASHPEHPGACHFYIHAVEAAQPAKAVACAERLANAMPGAGHLVHMPGHIYVRVGRWADAIAANEHAVHADEVYVRDQQPTAGVYTLGYVPHNHDFLAFAASMVGRSALAIDAARRTEAAIPAEMLGAPGLGMLQQGVTGTLRTLVRFGRWDEVLAAPEPADLPYVRGIWHWARGMAHAGKGELDAARTELERVRTLATDTTLASTVVGFNLASSVLAIARDVLAGEIEARAGQPQQAITLLRAAARAEDALTYGEPPDWPVPVRHHLGAVLLASGRAVDAERVYLEDLARFPENVWSLAGLVESLKAQGKTGPAADAQRRLDAARTGADVATPGSRY
jgi:tetratricopeptide (TPR) repeat protein